MKKKSRPIITIITLHKEEAEKKYFDIRPSIKINVKNGLILKVNKTYIPIRRNVLEIQLNLIDFSATTIDLKLFGALQKFKLSIPIKPDNQIAISKVELNNKVLLNNLALNNHNCTKLKSLDTSITLDTSKLKPQTNNYGFKFKKPNLFTPDAKTKVSLEGIEKELNNNIIKRL